MRWKPCDILLFVGGGDQLMNLVSHAFEIRHTDMDQLQLRDDAKLGSYVRQM